MVNPLEVGRVTSHGVLPCHLFRGEKKTVKPMEFRPFIGGPITAFITRPEAEAPGISSACRPDAGWQVAGP